MHNDGPHRSRDKMVILNAAFVSQLIASVRLANLEDGYTNEYIHDHFYTSVLPSIVSIHIAFWCLVVTIQYYCKMEVQSLQSN